MASGVPGRASNKVKQGTRADSWSAGQRRKKVRGEVQAAAAVVNRKIRASGGLTAWELACEVRRQARVAAGCRVRWEAGRKRDQLPSGVI